MSDALGRDELVRRFEEATLKGEHDWTHASHLRVASHYVASVGSAQAIERMRSGILRLNAARGVARAAYHETVTRAWVALVADFLAREDRGGPVSELDLRLVKELGQSGYLKRFYSSEALGDERAREGYVAPDVASLPGGPYAWIRDAALSDAPAIEAIYAPYVLESTCTFQTEPGTLDERVAWMTSHRAPHPILVAEHDGEVVAWGSLSPFHPRAAYARTVEDSIYVRSDWHRRGLGRRLLAALVARASSIGHHAVIAMISADQPGSVALHRELGFRDAGCLHEVGYKFGRWLDVVYLEMRLKS